LSSLNILQHPHLSPAGTWRHLFETAKDSTRPADAAIVAEMKSVDAMFVPSKLPASEEILRLLRENEPDTISIVAIGPLTNLAMTAAADPETFLRVKEVIVMGGTLNDAGNVSLPFRKDLPLSLRHFASSNKHRGR
jgi:inosine-uridine nucleoside N-ribohydrolase